MISTLAFLFLSSAVPQERPFPTAAVVPGAEAGEFRARGDFDGDGDLDLVWFAGDGVEYTGVTIFFDDAGTLTPGPHTPFGHATDYQFSEFRPCPGDFDGDGVLDFALALDGPAMPAGEGIEFFLGDGAGAFPSRLVLPLVTPWDIGVGNVDADAADELFVHHTDASFVRHLRWVDFQTGVPTALPALNYGPPTITGVVATQVLDVDGDGIDDVAATIRVGGPHAEFLQFFPTVAGAPTIGQQFPLPPEVQGGGHRLRAGDLDGDGDEDLVMVADATDVEPQVQVVERTANAWTLRPVVEVSGGADYFEISNLTLVDWDGDGWLDLASDGRNAELLVSDQAWGFSLAFELVLAGTSNGAGAFDVDGDGNPDLVVGPTIFYGDGGFELPVTEPVASSSFPNGAYLGDREGDGDVDVARDAGGLYEANDGSGAFTQAFFPTLAPFPALADPLQWAYPMAHADFDGDGLPEYLATFYYVDTSSPFGGIVEVGMGRIPEDGAGGYLAPVSATVWGDIFPEAQRTSFEAKWPAADADGDGDLDLLMDDGYRQNDGTGRLEVFVPAWPGRLRDAVDLDGDGHLDLLVADASGGSTALTVQRGSSTGFTADPLAIVAGDSQAMFVDLDGDGDLDVAAADRVELGLSLFENVGGTLSGSPTTFPGADVDALRNLGVVDVDGDGVLDLYVKEQFARGSLGNLTTLSVHLGTGTGLGYEVAARHLAPLQLDGFADVDGDGDLDAVGTRLLRGSLVDGEGGALLQYGDGVVGTGGRVPLLGATGPVRSTSGADELRLVNALGGSSFILVFGTIPTSLVDSPIPGLVQYVADPILFPLLPLGGAPGVAGAGHVEVALPNVAGLYGLTFVHQAFVIDAAAPAGWSASNGLAITYGE